MLGTINANGGLARASKYEVEITAPSVAQDLNRDMRYYCESAQLPGLTYQTDEIRTSGYGNIEKRPYTTIFQDVPLNFFCDADGRVMRFFHTWQQSVFNYNGRMSPFAVTERRVGRYTFAYPSEYFGTIDINVMNETSGSIIRYTLHEAYPITVSDVQVSWNNSDQILLLPVTIAYSYWTTTDIDQGTLDGRARTRENSLVATQTRIDRNLSLTRSLVED